MKKRASSMAAILAAVLLFSGCGAQSGGSSSQEPDSKNLASTESEPEISLDFDGEEIVFAYPWSLPSPESSPEAERHYQHVQDLNHKFNVKIVEKGISGAYYTTNMVTTVLAGKPMGHIMIAYGSSAADYYRAGVFADLTSAMKTAGIDFKDANVYNQSVTRFCNFDGKQVGFSNSVEVQKDLWFVNLRMLKEASIDIYDIVDKGEWTWDKAEELGKRLTKDTNSDGTPDIFGIGAGSAMDMTESMISSNGAALTQLDGEGRPVLSWNQPGALEAINRMYKWCTVDNICRPAATNQAWTQAATDFINGTYAMLHGPIDFLSNFQSAAMKDDFGVIPPPKGPNAQGDWYTSSGSIPFFQFIPVTYQDKAADLIQLYHAFTKDPDGRTKQECWEESYLDLVRDDKSMEYLLKLGFEGRQRLSLTTVVANSWGEPSMAVVFENLSKNTTSPGAATQEYTSQFQAQIDDKWNGVKLTGMN